MLPIESPFPQFFDLDGDPLNAGYVYIGVANQDPQTSPIQLFWDEAGLVLAPQPLNTIDGYIARNGAPALVYAAVDYSIRVRNRRGEQVLYAPNSANFGTLSQAQGYVDGLFGNLALTNGSANGAGMVGFNPTLNYVAGTIGARLKERVSVKDFPWLAKGDSNGTTGNGTDDTAALNACYAWAWANGYEVYEPPGIYRSTAPLVVQKGLSIVGAGTAPYDGAVGTHGRGSWHFFDHTGRGFSIAGTADIIQSTIKLAHLGTRRVQPTPGVGWAPTVYDFDIYINNADVLLEDVMLLNPSHGVQLVNGHAGRLRTRYLRGQPFVVGVDFVYSADVCVMEATHFWPFWRDHADVHAYTRANRDDVKLGRCDNPQISSFFSYGARAAFRFYENAFGRTQNFGISNANIDSCNIALWVDSTVTTGVNGQVGLLRHQGADAVSTSKMALIDGNNSTIECYGLNTQRSYQNGIKVNGTGNTLRIHGLTVANYDIGAAGYEAVEGLVGNVIRIEGLPTIINGGGGGKYGGAANIYVDEWREYTATYSTGTGTITTLGVTTSYFKLYADKVQYRIDATITTNGTGATNFRATLPYAQAASTPNSTGHGREVAATGHALTATLSAGSATLIIQKYDNTYPGGDGRRICVEGEFPV